MYHHFYELKYDPFTSTPDAASLFVSSSRQAVLHSITSGIKERRGLMAVVGEVGVGKTTLLRHNLERLAKLRTLFIPYAHLSFSSILQIMGREFGCDAERDDPVDMMGCLHETLLKEYDQGWNVVLILDEAQNDATILAIRERQHWNSPNLVAQDPVTLGLCSQIDLDAEVKKAAARLERERKEAGQAEAAATTRELVDAAIEYGGTYYLTYQLYPTPEQLHRAYPRAREAFERKKHYDPDGLFSSRFYERYGN